MVQVEGFTLCKNGNFPPLEGKESGMGGVGGGINV